MTNTWKRGGGLGDVRLDERADLVFERMVAAHTVVSKKIGGERAGEVAVGRLLSSPKADTARLLAPTTEINFAGRELRRRGFGPGGNGVAKGFCIHPVIATAAAGRRPISSSPGRSTR